MTALARELGSRDHEVVFMSLPDAEAFVQAAPMTFVPCCEKEFPAGSVNEVIGQLSEVQQDEALQFANQAAPSITEAK
jgi:zeaxanthin glucosyltransferase